MFANLALTPMQGLVFGLATLPITLWIIWTDVTDMKIKNQAVLAMIAVFVVAGLFLMPLPDYAWRFAHFAVALAICFLLHLTIGLGAGDAKYIAAAAMFVALPDLAEVAIIYFFWSVVLLVGMWIARRSSGIRAKHPDWVWIAEDRKGYVPFGLALAPTMSSYFLFGAMGGV